MPGGSPIRHDRPGWQRGIPGHPVTGRALCMVALVVSAALAAAWVQPVIPPGPTAASGGDSAEAAASQRTPGNRIQVRDHDDVQEAVERALAEAVAQAGISFALDSAQSMRLDDDETRIEGHGIALMGDGEPRYVSFMLRTSADGRTVGFDFGMQEPGGQVPLLADN